MKKAILYINQFFGAIGGEDQADRKPFIKEGAAGPGAVLQAALNGIEITHTIICGDNYMTAHTEDALAEIDGFLSRREFDLFFAGPAFQSGRYGMSCGEICRFVNQKYGVPAVTSMQAENPGVEAFRSVPVYIMYGHKSASKMREDTAEMARLGNKLAAGEEILWASAERYFGHGNRKICFTDKKASDRVVDLLLAKLSGSPYETEFPIEKSDQVIPAKAVANLKRARIALVTTGGLVPSGNPDRVPSGTASFYKGYDISNLDAFLKGEYYSVHGGFDTTNVNADPEKLFPLSAVKQLLKEGAFGSLYPKFLTTTGNLTIVKASKEIGAEMVKELKENHVDGVIMVAT